MATASGSMGAGADGLWVEHYHHDVIATRTLGFWLYMLSDAMIFAGLFAAYAVLTHRYDAAGGPTLHALVHPLSAYGETVAVFASVLAYGSAMVALKNNNRTGVLAGLGVAFLLGAVFLGLEVHDFVDLFRAGITPQDSGYLSAFFALVMTHGLHMAFGLLWMAVMFVQVATQGFTDKTVYRLLNLKLFWHFQAILWVLVFTFVDLRGVL
ncbi:cytochrome c oxidase subunit 3 [Acidiferrobacter sp.]|uniref:cytochrome c oxidase subunit 3 n=1 Tax=Acidiferrobacter sp. TaxID=1872107 RepID=UPI002623DC7E|nr:cytochrome c oxidase subunit 3 [Acidiferrobacter sp.]